MPKQKTHKGAAKRLRVTAKKKIKRGSAGMSHLMSTMSGKRRRRLRKGGIVPAGTITDNLLKMLGEK
jgi:large subunit ribosomal protein L35